MSKYSKFLYFFMPVMVVLGVITLNVFWWTSYSPFPNQVMERIALTGIFVVPISGLLIPFLVRRGIGKTGLFGLLTGCLIWLAAWFLTLLYIIKMSPKITQNWLESGLMTVDQVSEMLSGAAFYWGGLSLLAALIVFVGGNFLAMDAMIHTQNQLRFSLPERLQQTDWRSAVLSIFILIFSLAAAYDSEFFPIIFNNLFFDPDPSWKIVSLVIAIVAICFILFAFFASLVFLLGKREKFIFVDKAATVFEIITLAGAVILAIVLVLLRAFHVIESMVGEFMIIGVYLPFFLAIVWEPRGLVKVTREKSHRLLAQGSFWLRVILLPVTIYLLQKGVQTYIPRTFEWASVILFIASIYYAFCGLLQLLLLIPRFKSWLEERVGILRQPANPQAAVPPEHAGGIAGRTVLEKWVRRLIPKAWWMSEENQNTQPLMKVILFGVSSWIIMKVVDMLFDNLLGLIFKF